LKVPDLALLYCGMTCFCTCGTGCLNFSDLKDPDSDVNIERDRYGDRTELPVVSSVFSSLCPIDAAINISAMARPLVITICLRGLKRGDSILHITENPYDIDHKAGSEQWCCTVRNVIILFFFYCLS
jgi:hypothetical protein